MLKPVASPENKEQQVKAADRCDTQEDFVVKCQVVVTGRGPHHVQVIDPKQLVGKEADNDDADEKQVFQLGPELLVGQQGVTQLPPHRRDDEDLEHQQNHRGRDNNEDDQIVDDFHTFFIQLFVEIETPFMVIHLSTSILGNYQGHHDDNHQQPQASTGSHSVQFPVELHLVLVLQEHEVPDDQDHHVEQERQVHVDVQHGAHELTEGQPECPLLLDEVGQAERHRQQEDAVDHHQVDDGHGGHRAGVHFHQQEQNGDDARQPPSEHRGVETS